MELFLRYLVEEQESMYRQLILLMTVPVHNTGVYSSPNNTFQRRFSPIGQGFMIEGNASGATVTMKNNYRVYVKEGALNFSEFEKGAGLGKEQEKTPQDSYLKYHQFQDLIILRYLLHAVPQIQFNTLLNNQGIRQMVLSI